MNSFPNANIKKSLKKQCVFKGPKEQRPQGIKVSVYGGVKVTKNTEIQIIDQNTGDHWRAKERPLPPMQDTIHQAILGVSITLLCSVNM